MTIFLLTSAFFLLHLFASNTGKCSDDVIMTSQWRQNFRILPNSPLWFMLSIIFFCVSLKSFGSSKLKLFIRGLIFKILENSNRSLQQTPQPGIELSLFQLKFLSLPDIQWTLEYSKEFFYFYSNSWSLFFVDFVILFVINFRFQNITFYSFE